ncbi:Crp/Fnr family transcriptional regulator [uncultured Hymenobacter sp.]|uniref:Crp/Fnr family transcriptional regulator n=1 Tax=uncultured Hymenobacter sp. TaxID=170016 RepID=UPI0035CAC7A2
MSRCCCCATRPWAGKFIRLLAGRVGERKRSCWAWAHSSIRRRVADALLHLHAQAAGAAGGRIHSAREDLAAVGTAPESVIRTLSEFNQNGLIKPGLRTIRVREPDKLRRAAGRCLAGLINVSFGS